MADDLRRRILNINRPESDEALNGHAVDSEHVPLSPVTENASHSPDSFGIKFSVGSKVSDDNLHARVGPNPPSHSGVLSVKPGNYDMVRDLQIQTLTAKAETLKAEYLECVDKELDTLINKFVSEAVPKSELAVHHVAYTGTASPGMRRGDKSGELLRKEFVARNSYLTDLFEIPHINTIQSIFIAVLIIFAANTIISDIFDHGTIGVDYKVWLHAFAQLPSVVMFWLAMQASTLFVVYWGITFWAKNRQKSEQIDLFDKFWLLIYTGYLLIFLVVPAWFIMHFELPPGSAGIVVGEQVRMLMKTHAFVREKIPDVIKLTVAQHPDPAPDFHRYLYFQYIPTLVYRDNYPRIKAVRWNLVLKNFAQFLGGVLYCNYVYIRFCIPAFRNFNREHVSVGVFLKAIFDAILPGSLHFMVIFYAFLHAWMNAFGEMLRFADRLFYRDWWNSTTFSNYYRTWNIVVHDWLYSYVYVDIVNLLGQSYRTTAMLVTFLLSAVVHEYLMCCLLRMFYPVIFVLFAVFGVWMVFVTKTKSSHAWNVVMWLSIFLGQGVLMTLYGSEYYARLNCPPTTDNFWDKVIPRSWMCYVWHPTLNYTTEA
ncbi:sterol O-acyltransferase 2-like [Paramacrobiotus metropolitanus]|uniref:sterol O-acyltransferase 2-like n=1 Tax=Paramacrobiotus metropolitanus TaxID=2943436 RepID=UPI0024460981|nr:sterol O-acyltransferase 2-like [Paramacrobiotus metropolitanus]